jgi:hypothetical protein
MLQKIKDGVPLGIGIALGTIVVQAVLSFVVALLTVLFSFVV